MTFTVATYPDYFAAKPADVSFWAWLWHPMNLNPLPTSGFDLLKKIQALMKAEGWTYCLQASLAEMMELSERWTRDLLKRLIEIGFVEERRRWKVKQYRLTPLAYAGPVCALTSGETSGDNRITTTTHVGTQEPLNLINARAKTPDEIKQDPIVRTFEEATGSTYRHDRDHQALGKLKSYGETLAVIGILMSAVRVAMSNYNNKLESQSTYTNQIRSLAYCVPATQEAAEVKGINLNEYLRYLRSKLAQWVTGQPQQKQGTPSEG